MLEVISRYLRSNCFSFKQKSYLSIPGSDNPASEQRRVFYNKYKILQKIGSGGYGTVFKVQRRADGAEFAAKIVPQSRCRRTSWCENRLMQVSDEVVLWEGLDHPNILKLEETYFEKNHWIIITEYNRDYVDLFDYINSSTSTTAGVQKLSEQDIVSILRQIICAALYLRQQGIDHRDIKDENILYNPASKQVKLLDFGSASRLPGGENAVYTHIQGTDIYLPPEYYQTGVYSADNGTVWSIGCLAYVMFNSRPPFVNRDDVKTAEMKWWVEVRPLVRDFVDGCLEREPKQRSKLADLLQYDCFK